MIHDTYPPNASNDATSCNNNFRYIDLIELNVSDQYKAHSFHDLRYSYYDV